jgi:hypothetical protein
MTSTGSPESKFSQRSRTEKWTGEADGWIGAL